MKDLIQYTAALLVLLLVTLIVLSFQLPDIGPQRLVYNHHRRDGLNKNSTSSTSTPRRLAILLPYIGSSAADIPPYLDLFCYGASGSSAIADFIILHNGVLQDYDKDDAKDNHVNDKKQQQTQKRHRSPCHMASNVQFVNLHNTTNMARLFLRVLDDKIEASQKDGAEEKQLAIPYEHLLSLLTIHLERYPYILVEFKPALGYIMHEYLLDKRTSSGSDGGERYKYTHWAYSDLDILWGDLDRHLEPDEWERYHVVTFSFGDQQRLYARGQFTMHKLPKVPPTRDDFRRQAQDANEFTTDVDGKDAPSLLTLWKPCPYLSHLDVRFANIVHNWQEQQKQKGGAKKPLFQLESAEGCYSVALLQNEDITVKFAVKAWTDEQHAHEIPRASQAMLQDTMSTHGLYVSRGPRHGASSSSSSNGDDGMIIVLTKQTSPSTPVSVSNLTNWWKDDVAYQDLSQPLQQQSTGAMEQLALPVLDTTSDKKSKDNKNCMYWVQEQYQPYLCLHQGSDAVVVTANDNVFWVKGELFKQSFQNRPLYGNSVLTAPFFHFQEWKRSFRFNQLATASSMTLPTTKQVASTLDLSTFVLSKDGVTPLSFCSHKTIKRNRMRLGGAGGSSTSSSSASTTPLGIPPYAWNAGNLTAATAAHGHDRSQLPSHHYCLSFDQANRFAVKCRFQTSWQDVAHVHVASWAPAWQKMSEDNIHDDVTLVLTWQIDLKSSEGWQDLFESVVTRNLQRWQGQPIVFVIALSANDSTVDGVSTTTHEALTFLRDGLSSELDGDEKHDILESALIAIVVVPEASEDFAADEQDRIMLSRKALLNMAIDCVPTRWHVAGLEMEQGLILSTQTVVFAHRAADTYGSLQHSGGNIFWIPQFGLTGAAASKTGTTDTDTAIEMSLSQLVEARQKGRVQPLPSLDPVCTSLSVSPDSHSRLDTVWWAQTRALVDPSAVDAESDSLARLALLLQQAEHDILGLLVPDKYDILLEKVMYSSPLLLVDNAGPQTGIHTHLVARQTEELVGGNCFNPLQLAQLLAQGYRLNVLEGAHALSTDASRKLSVAASTSLPSRCGTTGCFLFRNKHDKLLKSIVHEEISRSAKTGALFTDKGAPVAVALG